MEIIENYTGKCGKESSMEFAKKEVAAFFESTAKAAYLTVNEEISMESNLLYFRRAIAQLATEECKKRIKLINLGTRVIIERSFSEWK